MQLHVCPSVSVGADKEPFGGAMGLECWQPTSNTTGVTALGNVWAVNACSAEGVAVAGCGRGCGAASATGACAEEAVASEGVAAEQPAAEEVQIQQSGAWGTPVSDHFGDQYFAMCLARKVLPTISAQPAFGSHSVGPRCMTWCCVLAVLVCPEAQQSWF